MCSAFCEVEPRREGRGRRSARKCASCGCRGGMGAGAAAGTGGPARRELPWSGEAARTAMCPSEHQEPWDLGSGQIVRAHRPREDVQCRPEMTRRQRWIRFGKTIWLLWAELTVGEPQWQQ